MPSAWDKELSDFQSAGFTDTEISSEQSRLKTEMFQNGFSGKEIDGYFGVKEPDLSPIKNYFETNLRQMQAEKAAKEPTGTPTGVPVPPEQKAADNFIEAFQSGWQMSDIGLITRGKKPEEILSEDAPMLYRMASQVGQLSGDIPAMVAGGFGGGIAGATAGPVGAIVGSGAGSLALPTAIREMLMKHYEDGDIQSFSDFWERSSAIFLNTLKSGVIGGLTAGTGGVVAKAVSPIAAPLAAKSLTALSEVATMVTAGKALEGQVPNPQDFIDAGVLVGGLHAAGIVSTKLRNSYAQTGIKPSQIALEAQNDPVLKQELLSKNVDVPKAFEGEKINPPTLPTPEPPLPLPSEPKAAITDVPSTLSEAESKILSNVGEKQKAERQYSFRDAYKDWVDKLDPINEAIKQLDIDPNSLTADKNPYQLARMANDYKAKTKYAMEKGTLDYKSLAKNGEGLSEIITPFKEDLDSLNAYLISKRAIEVEARGQKSGFDVDAAKEVVSKGGAKFEEVSNRIVDFQNRILKYAKDSGRISEDLFNALVTANKSYIPFARLLEPEEIEAGGKQGKSSSLNKFKGSEKSIQSPLISVLENTESIFRMAEKNRATSALIDLAENTPNQTLFEKIPANSLPVQVNEKEIQRFFDENAIDASAKELTVFRKQTKSFVAPNEFEVFRDGKREIWKTDHHVAEAIKALDGDVSSQNLFMKFASTLTAIKKIGVTFTPDFIFKNVFRDQLTAGTFTKEGAIPFVDTVKAMGDLIAKNDTYYDWLKAGGANGSFLEVNADYLEKNIFGLNKETGFLDHTFNLLKKPVDFVKAAGELAEQATRLGEFKRISQGATEGAKIFEGGFGSREVTVDFQRIGAKLSAFNAITAFQNVAIQGLDRTFRAIKEDPQGVGLKAAAYITAPSVLLWWANHNDERYKDIPQWQKDLFWIIPTDSWQKVKDQKEISGIPPYLLRQKNGEYEVNRGTIYRIPKPQELGLLFGTIPERTLEAFFTDNPRALKGFEQTIGNLMTPAFVPDAVTPFMEHFANKNYFTGTPIVPYSSEKLLPEYQYTDYTTETAKALGKMIAKVPGVRDIGTQDLKLASPLVIENYVRSWSGTLGMYALQLSDKALTTSGAISQAPLPANTLADIPFVKAFVVRYPSAGAQGIVDFRERFSEGEKVLDTIKFLAKSGQFTEMQTVLAENQDKVLVLKDTKTALTNLGQTIQKVYNNKNFSRDDKRQMIDGLYYTMIQAANNGNKILDKLDMTFKKATKEKKK